MNQPLFDMPEGEPHPPEADRRLSPEREEQQFVGLFTYLLTAPLIGWPGWEDQVAAQKENITLNRLAHGREIFDQEMCTEFEAMMYLSSASLAHPMNHEWTEIYGWLFCQWKPEEGREIWEREIVLERNQVESLNRLRRWIFRRQMESATGGKARERQSQEREVSAKEPKPQVMEPNMFDFTEGE